MLDSKKPIHLYFYYLYLIHFYYYVTFAFKKACANLQLGDGDHWRSAVGTLVVLVIAAAAGSSIKSAQLASGNERAG